jgi:hypothetical protein
MKITQLSPILTHLNWIIDELLQTVGFRWRGNITRRGFGPVPPLPIAIINLVAARLRRARSGIIALMARFQAGTLRTYAPRTAPAKPRAPATTKRSAPEGPRKFGWLIPLMQHEAVPYAEYLRLLLAEPEMQALLAASDQARRILAPACRMLGIEKEHLTTTQVGRINEAQSAVATLPQAEPSPPPPPRIPDILPPHHLRVLWRPQSDP